jgi:hypothetical protein
MTYNYASRNASYWSNGVRFTATQLFPALALPYSGAGYSPLTIGYGEGGFSAVRAAQVQLYNVTLHDMDIQAMYKKGVWQSPPPTRTDALVAWWPLNGDARDHSGNGFHGAVLGNVKWDKY